MGVALEMRLAPVGGEIGLARRGPRPRERCPAGARRWCRSAGRLGGRPGSFRVVIAPQLDPTELPVHLPALEAPSEWRQKQGLGQMLERAERGRIAITPTAGRLPLATGPRGCPAG